MPEMHRRLAITQIHHAGWVELVGLEAGNPQLAKQPLVNAVGFKSGHLGDAGVEDIGAAPESTSTSVALVISFQQIDLEADPSQQSCSGHSGDAGAYNHNPAVFTALHSTMLAAERQRL